MRFPQLFISDYVSDWLAREKSRPPSLAYMRRSIADELMSTFWLVSDTSVSMESVGVFLRAARLDKGVGEV